MNTAVRYHSRGGKTRKLAEAVAKAVGTKALPVSEPLTAPVDLLFICTAPYAFNVDKEVKDFIDGINVKVGRAVAVSSTAALKSIRKYLEKPLSEKNIPLATEEFCCRGEFMMLHKGKPDSADLKAAADFAKKMASGGGKR